MNIIVVYGGLLVVQSFFVFAFIYLTGVLGQRVRYDMRKKMFDHLQEAVVHLLQPHARRLDHVARDVGHRAHRRAGDVGDAGRGLGVINIITALIFMLTHQLAVGADGLLPSSRCW